MTAGAVTWAVAVCALLMSAVGIVTASAQGVLSPSPMIEHRSAESGRAAPAPNSAAAKRSNSPSQAMAGTGPVKPDLSEEIGDWLLQCFSKPNRVCRLSQRQVNPKNQAMLIWVELTHTMTPHELWQLVVMLPLGFRVAPVQGIRADRELLVDMPIVTCVTAGCAYSTEMPVAGLETMRKAQTLETEIVDLKGQKYALKVSMRGFSQAFLKSALKLKAK